jgi:hypothetical protein
MTFLLNGLKKLNLQTFKNIGVCLARIKLLSAIKTKMMLAKTSTFS